MTSLSENDVQAVKADITNRGAIRSGLTPQQIKDILDRHNNLRRNEGASNMEVMVSVLKKNLICSYELCTLKSESLACMCVIAQSKV